VKQSPYFEELLKRQKRMKKVFKNSVCCKCACVDDLKWKDEVSDVICKRCFVEMIKEEKK
jgi:hypothetical protein